MVVIKGIEFGSKNEYKDYLARRKIHPETGQLFESRTAYENYLAKQRQGRPENQKLGDLIKRRLNDLDKDQKWLAARMGVTEEAVSCYVHGEYTPRDSKLTKLFSALEVNYRTLDDLLIDAEAVLS